MISIFCWILSVLRIKACATCEYCYIVRGRSRKELKGYKYICKPIRRIKKAYKNFPLQDGQDCLKFKKRDAYFRIRKTK